MGGTKSSGSTRTGGAAAPSGAGQAPAAVSEFDKFVADQNALFRQQAPFGRRDGIQAQQRGDQTSFVLSSSLSAPLDARVEATYNPQGRSYFVLTTSNSRSGRRTTFDIPASMDAVTAFRYVKTALDSSSTNQRLLNSLKKFGLVEANVQTMRVPR